MIPTILPSGSSGPNSAWANMGYGFHQSSGGDIDFMSPLEEIQQKQTANLQQLLQQNDTPQDALSQLKILAKDDPAYMELYLQLLAERENNAQAWKQYEDFNNSYFQRTTKDLEAAGLNPWLALQSLGSSGNGSISPAGTWSSSAYSSKASMKSAQATSSKALLGLAGVIFAALIYALL